MEWSESLFINGEINRIQVVVFISPNRMFTKRRKIEKNLDMQKLVKRW